MTLTEAVAVLNREKHGGEDTWQISAVLDPGPQVENQEDGWERIRYPEFVAVAIAEKYEREREERALEGQARSHVWEPLLNAP